MKISYSKGRIKIKYEIDCIIKIYYPIDIKNLYLDDYINMISNNHYYPSWEIGWQKSMNDARNVRLSIVDKNGTMFLRIAKFNKNGVIKSSVDINIEMHKEDLLIMFNNMLAIKEQ